MVSLSPRVAQALSIVARGDQTARATIASQMAISPRTAGVYINLLKTLGLIELAGGGSASTWSATKDGLKAYQATKKAGNAARRRQLTATTWHPGGRAA